ncbi:unnamed protein product [Coregonus sp. 'balchen']|nr:unnamed protein product [Coregonus sp. 'balchen']
MVVPRGLLRAMLDMNERERCCTPDADSPSSTEHSERNGGARGKVSAGAAGAGDLAGDGREEETHSKIESEGERKREG